MVTTDKTRAMQSVVADIGKKKITFDSYLQRKTGQWSRIQKSKLIDSILRGYPVPPVYAIAPKPGVSSVIDGCQRLTTVYEYMNDDFPLSSELNDINVNGNDITLKKKKFKSLPIELQDKIKNSEIIIITLTDYTDDELVSVFDRLNGGTALSTAQKNKVYMSFELAGIVTRIADKPPLSNIGISDMQFKRDENQSVVVQAMMLLNPTYASSGFSKNEIKKYLLDVSNSINYRDLDKLADMVDSLKILFPEKNKACKKAMVAPLIWAIEPIYQDEAKMKQFKVELDKFLADPTSYPDYVLHSSLHTTAAIHVRGRAEFFRQLVTKATGI